MAPTSFARKGVLVTKCVIRNAAVAATRAVMGIPLCQEEERTMLSTMMRVPLSLNHVLERAGALFPESHIVSGLPDKSLRRHRCAGFSPRAGPLASARLR